MNGVIEYYEKPASDYRTKLVAGQVAIAPVPYLLENKICYLRLDYHDVSKPHNSNYAIETRNINEFTPSLSTRYLISKALTADEFILCVFHKFRPVILLTDEIPSWSGETNHTGFGFLVAPLYSVKDDEGKDKFEGKFIKKVAGYQYPTLFYLPENDEFDRKESIVRFDRIAFIRKDVLNPCPVRLTYDAMFCVTTWLKSLLSGEVDETIKAYQEIVEGQL